MAVAAAGAAARGGRVSARPAATAGDAAAGGQAAVDVVVAVYNAPADLARCVDSVLAHTRGAYRLVLIDDASEDPAIGTHFAALAARALPQVVLLRNDVNLGFTGTANRGLRLSSSADVVLLNSDTIVTAGWLDALARCAASEPAVGTATPFSNNAEICSFPRFCADNPWPEGADPEFVRAALARAAVPTYPDLPTGVGFCLYVRRALIDAIGIFDPAFGKGYGEENDFCLRAVRAGYRNVLCDDAFVVHAGERSFAGRKTELGPRNMALLLDRHPQYLDLVRAFIAADPLQPLRAAAQAQLRAQAGGIGVLHVVHGHGGGTEHHVRALIDASRSRYRHYLAIATGERWQVEEHLEDGAVRNFEFLRHDGEPWRDFVGGLAATLRIGLVHLHNISGCREGILDALAGLPLPYGYTVHDLNFACPTITFLGPDATYCGAQTDTATCERCLGAQSAFAGVDIVAWRARHRELLARAAFLIAPAQWTANTLRRYFPELAVDVIAHGAPGAWAAQTAPAGAGSDGDDNREPRTAPRGGPARRRTPDRRRAGGDRPRQGRAPARPHGRTRACGRPPSAIRADRLSRPAPDAVAERRRRVHDPRPLPAARPSRPARALPGAPGRVSVGGAGDVQPDALGGVGRGAAGAGAADWRAGRARGRHRCRLGPGRRRMARRRADARARRRTGRAERRRGAGGGRRARPRPPAADACGDGRADAGALRADARRSAGGRGATARTGARARRARVLAVDGAGAAGRHAGGCDGLAAGTRGRGAPRRPRGRGADGDATRSDAAGARAAAADAGAHPRGAEGAVVLMASPAYPDWLARGRGHLQQGRPIDAMLCFRRAIRAGPRAVEASFHLGEALWQLGQVRDAIAAWREASALAPDSAAVLLPLAESLLATGDAAGARDVAAHALAVTPPAEQAIALHATALHAVARLTLGDAGAGEDPFVALTRVLDRHLPLFAIPTVAGPLALALDAARERPGRAAFLARLARRPAPLAEAPPLLLALVLEHALADTGGDADDVRGALLQQAAARGYAPDDHDALRRIALAAARLRAPAAAVLGAHYASLVAFACAAPLPLPWPRRCAGDRLRVVALVGPDGDEAAHAALARLAAAAGEDCDVTLALFGAAPRDPSPADAVRALPALALSPLPDVAEARRIAAIDPDVLVDLAGLTAATGPLLAQHPARRALTLARLAAPNAPPLVDRVLSAEDDLIAAVRALAAQTPAPQADALDPRAMTEAWERAVHAHQQGDRASARTQYARILESQPGFAPAHYLRGLLGREAEDLAAAGEDFAAALAAAPGYVDARLAAARLALAAGDAAAAGALCAGGLALLPHHAELLRTGGLAELARRDGAAAAKLFEAAAAVEATDGDTHYNHGVALQMARDFPAAARAYQRALAFQPDLVAADFNLGVIFQEQGNADAAIAAYGNVLTRDPGRVAAYRNLGETLLAAGRLDAWFANFRRFEANRPEALALAVQALEVLQHHGDFAGLERYLQGLQHERYRAADELELCDNLEQLLYLLLFFDVAPDVAFRFAQTYDATAQRVYGTPLSPAARRPGRIRVGYLSADLRNHVMGKMVWQAVEHHDRSRFELHFYSLSRERDEWTERFARLAERFEVVADLSEREAARRIAAADLDLLVDLSTHTRGAKPGILALKPARVQLTHVASAGSVGLSAIDFKLTDRYADVPESQAQQMETLLPMEGCAYPFRRTAPAATHPFHRAALGIPADDVLIGAFVTPLKLSQRCLGLWRDVLAQVPRARLAFSPTRPSFQASYLRLAAAAGIAPERLLFLPQGRDDAENQARYGLVDFVLDPMPYGGANGTLEALDMGVPVVTLVGRRHSERTSYSMLANLGVTQTVAQGGREYVDIAVRLAREPAFMREVRAAIAAGLARSPLTDAIGHTRHLEAAYVEALRQRAPDALQAAEAGRADRDRSPDRGHPAAARCRRCAGCPRGRCRAAGVTRAARCAAGVGILAARPRAGGAGRAGGGGGGPRGRGAPGPWGRPDLERAGRAAQRRRRAGARDRGVPAGSGHRSVKRPCVEQSRQRAARHRRPRRGERGFQAGRRDQARLCAGDCQPRRSPSRSRRRRRGPAVVRGSSGNRSEACRGIVRAGVAQPAQRQCRQGGGDVRARRSIRPEGSQAVPAARGRPRAARRPRSGAAGVRRGAGARPQTDPPAARHAAHAADGAGKRCCR